MKTATRRRALTVEMTSGSLWKNILLFSLPLMMTQVLEVDRKSTRLNSSHSE